MFVFLLTRHGRKNRSTWLLSVLGTWQATAGLSGVFMTHGGERWILPCLCSLTCLEGWPVQAQQFHLWLADVLHQKQVLHVALLGQHWGHFARMVSFICIATFLMHTRWPNAVLTLNHLDDMKFRWAQHVPVCCCRSPPLIFELVLPARVVCKSGTNQMGFLDCAGLLQPSMLSRKTKKTRQETSRTSRVVLDIVFDHICNSSHNLQ